MQKAITIASILSATTLLAGCAAPPALTSGAKQVTVSRQAPAKKCKRISYVKATDARQMVPAQDLEKGAVAKLKNLAAAHKANYVHITQNYSNTFVKGDIENNAMASVTVKGVAYACPR